MLFCLKNKMGLPYTQLKSLIWKNYLSIKKDKRNVYLYILVTVAIIFIQTFTGIGVSTSPESIFISYNRTETSSLKNLFQNSLTYLIPNNELYLGFIYPNSNEENEQLTNSVMQNEIFSLSNVKPKIFENEKSLEEFYENQSYNLLAGIIFQNNLTSYTIRMDHSYVTSPLDPVYNTLELKNNETNSDIYLKYFVPIQSAVDQAIIQHKTNSSVQINSNVGGLAIPKVYIGNSDHSIFVINFMLLFFLYYAMMPLPIYICDEKEHHIKKILSINGVSSSLYYLSWMILYFIMITIPLIVCAIIEIVIGVYSPANMILKFLSFFLFAIGTLPLFTFLSVLFTDSKTLNEIVTLVGTVLILIPYVFKYISDNIIILDYIFVCLPSGRIIGKVYENTVMGITTFKDVFGDSYTLNCFVCIFVGSFLFFIITIVSDSIINEEAEPLFGGLFNKRGKDHSDSEKSSEVYKEDIETFSTDDRCLADISNIVKKFKFSKKQQKNNGKTNEDFVEGSEFCALNNVSFKVYENEIFGILGHNGAGKSTLLNIMTGLINPNEGQVYYDGEDFINNKDKIRHLFGVCPQECGLFEKLTVEQNLLIFPGLKEIDINVDEILSEVDLLDKKKNTVNILSGGQKKKLNIAIALMGNPKFVFLDEPTTGLDPLSRRNMWDLLKKNKNGKVIFLSTHYMDEADILTDRKLILHKGVIRCLGSSMYLKKHFNMMYNLKVETENYNEACSIIQSRIPESFPVIESDADNDSDHVYTFKIPMDSVSKISGLIKELEEHSKQHHIIKKFSISLPSLEELFVRLELYKNKTDSTNTNNKDNTVANENDANTNTDTFVLIDKKVNLPHCENLNKLTYSQKISVLIKFRYLYFKSKSFIFNIIIVPIIFFVGIFLFSKLSSSNKKVEFEPFDLSYDKLYGKTLWNYDTQQSNMDPEIFKAVFGQANMSSYDIQFLDGVDGANVTSKNNYSFSMNSNNNGTDYTIDVYYNKTMSHSPPSIFNGLSNAILKSQNVNDKITVYSNPFTYFDIMNYSTVLFYMCYFVGMVFTMCLSTLGLMIMKEKVKGLKKQLHLNQVDSKNYYISNLIIDFSIYGLLSIMVIIIGLIFQYEPFLNLYSVISFLLIAILSSVASLLFQYTLSLFFKKEHIAYATFAIIHLIMLLIVIIVLYIQNIGNIDINYILSEGAVYASIISTIIYPPIALVIAIYLTIQMNMYHITHNLGLTSDNYLKYRNGFVPVLLSSLISCLAYYYLLTYLDKKLNNNKEAESKMKENSPIVEQNEAILRENEDLYHEMELVKSENESMPLSILHLVKEFTVVPRTSGEKHRIRNRKTYQYGEHHSSKYIPGKLVKTVIEDVSFGTREKECFGLLGPNGVGKSTLLNSITSTINQTYGKIYFNGVESNQYDGIIGYCPQEDILWDELSPLDHVMFYLRLRGLPENLIKDYAHQYIKYCQIEEHMNKPVSKLSGGTKRKLCILLAVCGSPKQVILDEPTSGIDPATRLFIWDMIKEMKEREKSSMILTTHSMEEAQELCDRLTILINGRLVCIGSPEYLRMKYANSYVLEVQTEQQETVHEMVFGSSSYFSSCTYKMETITSDRFKYQIELNEGLGKLFDIMENAKNNKTIKDYTISQSNLEQVFIDFAKQFIQ